MPLLTAGRIDTTVLVCVVIALPSRVNPMVTVWSPLARISGVSCSQLVTAVPPKLVMVSPGCRPASFAGATGSEGVQAREASFAGTTQSET